MTNYIWNIDKGTNRLTAIDEDSYGLLEVEDEYTFMYMDGDTIIQIPIHKPTRNKGVVLARVKLTTQWEIETEDADVAGKIDTLKSEMAGLVDPRIVLTEEKIEDMDIDEGDAAADADAADAADVDALDALDDLADAFGELGFDDIDFDAIEALTDEDFTKIKYTTKEAIHSDLKLSKISELISRIYDIDNQISLAKMKSLLHSMVHNWADSRHRTSLGSVLYYNQGTPDWLMPVVCETPVETNPTGTVYNQGSYKKCDSRSGCDLLKRRPHRLEHHVLDVIGDDPTKAPGLWKLVGSSYAQRVMSISLKTSGEDGESETKARPMRPRNMPLPDYVFKIELTHKWQQKIDNANKGEGKNYKKRARVFAHAITEPGAVKRVTVEQEGTDTSMYVVGVHMTPPIGKSTTYDVSCRAGDNLEDKYLDVLNTAINDALASAMPHILNRIRNHGMLEDVLKHFNLSQRHLPPSTLREVTKALVRHAKDRVVLDMTEHGATMVGYALDKKRAFRPSEQVDRGMSHYCNELDSYLTKHGSAMTDALAVYSGKVKTGVVPEGRQFQSSLPVINRDGSVYYKSGADGRYYTAVEHGELAQYNFHNYLKDLLNPHNDFGSFGSFGNVSEKCKELLHTYNHMVQGTTTQDMLGGMSIDIISTTQMPKGSDVMRFLSEIDEGDLYLQYLEHFEVLGMVMYDSSRGRYVTAGTGEMIICICNKTFIQQKSTFLSKEEFLTASGSCKYCHSQLIDAEQAPTWEFHTSRELIAFDNSAKGDDTYLSFITFLSALYELLDPVMNSYHWQLNDTEKESLKDKIIEYIIDNNVGDVDPFGFTKPAPMIAINTADDGDLRSFLMDAAGADGTLYQSKKSKKKGRKKAGDTRILQDRKDLDLEKLVKKYITRTTGQKLSDYGLKLKSVEGVDTTSNIYLNIIHALPIYKVMVKNIAVACAYITSGLELKYANQSQVKGDNFATFINSVITPVNMHHICNTFTAHMYGKLSVLKRLLSKMTTSDQTAWKTIYEPHYHLYTDADEHTFNIKATQHFSKVLETPLTLDETYNTIYSDALTEVRNTLAKDYESRPVEELVYTRNIYSFYNKEYPKKLPKPSTVNNVDSLMKCREIMRLASHKYINTITAIYNGEMKHYIDHELLTGNLSDLPNEHVQIFASGQAGFRICTTDNITGEIHGTISVGKTTELIDDTGGSAKGKISVNVSGNKILYKITVDNLSSKILMAYFYGNLNDVVVQSADEEESGPSIDLCDHTARLSTDLVYRKFEEQDMDIKHLKAYSGSRGEVADLPILTEPNPENCGRSASAAYQPLNYSRGHLPAPTYHQTLHPELSAAAQLSDTSVTNTPSQEDRDQLLQLIAQDEDYRDEQGGQGGIDTLLLVDGSQLFSNVDGVNKYNYVFHDHNDATVFITEALYNDQLQKSLDMKHIRKYQDEGLVNPPAWLGADFPGSAGTKSSHEPDASMKKVAQVQYIGKFLVYICQWLARDVDDDEEKDLQAFISASRMGNVLGAESSMIVRESKSVDMRGYTLDELYALKLKLTEDTPLKDALKKYKTFTVNPEGTSQSIYDMSYSFYQSIVNSLPVGKASRATTDDFLRLVSMSIKLDVLRNYLSIGGQYAPEKLTLDDAGALEEKPLQKRFIHLINELLIMMAKHAGPEITDPLHKDIEKLRDERFASFASSGKYMKSAKDSFAQTGINHAGNGLAEALQAQDAQDEAEDVDDDAVYNMDGEGGGGEGEGEGDDAGLDEVPDGMEQNFGDAGEVVSD